MIDCPKCRSGSRVTNSRQTHGTVRRRRECERCGHRWTTREISDEEWLEHFGPPPPPLRPYRPNNARRGFAVPESKREDYRALRKKGIPAREAARVLGIIPAEQEKRP